MRGRTTRCGWAALAALCLAGLGPQVSLAQDDDEHETYEYHYNFDRYAFAIGGGIVLPDNEDGEIYLSASFRWRAFNRDAAGRDRGRRESDRARRGVYSNMDDSDDRTDVYNRRHNRYGDYSEGIRGYLEPEIGYWERSGDGRTDEDLLVGLNLVGVVPTRAADFFVGVGFGLHFVDAVDSLTGLDESDERLGANLQVGVELNLSDRVGLFGTGRLDVIEEGPNDRQTKIWGGLRFHFGGSRRGGNDY